MWQGKVALLLQVGVSYPLEGSLDVTAFPASGQKQVGNTPVSLYCVGGDGAVTPPSENPTALLPNPFNTALPSYNLRGGQAWLISSLHWRLSPPEALKECHLLTKGLLPSIILPKPKASVWGGAGG